MATVTTPSKPSTHPSKIFPEITTCTSISHLKQIHAQMIKTSQIRHPLALPQLLHFTALSPHKDLPYALSLFYQMDRPNCFSYNTLSRALVENNGNNDSSVDNGVKCESLDVDAFGLFYKMMCDEFVRPNRFTFPSVLKGCAQMGWLEEGRQVHGLVVKFGLVNDEFVVSNLVRMYVLCGAMIDAFRLFNERKKVGESFGGGGGDDGEEDFEKLARARRKEGDVVLWNVMVDGYVRLGDLQAARAMFNRMPSRSVVSWNAMISGYAQHGMFKEAVEMFHEMQTSAVGPNYVTLVSVLPAIARLGAIELGKWVHLYVERKGFEIDDVLGSALVDMYAKCGSIEKALQVFQKLPKKNPITWNAIIGGLAMHGRAKDALDYFSRMEHHGVTPTDVAYISVLMACSYAGFVDQGRTIFNHMCKEVGLEPRMEHYGCMVDLLGRAGYLDEAEELVLSMPIEPDDVIWKALLGACKMHGNAEMGERIAKRLMEMDPHDSGSYVALSNIFASLGNWQAVAELRLMMKEKDIRKDPGCSWFEDNGVIHEFLVEDDTHPRAPEIHSMLEEIANKLRSVGYRPKTSQVLLNVDEEGKESALHYHSEKIAIAFGLVSTSPGTGLRIVKNLRICEDCHASIKLISKIYKRRIVVRDRKRFHHFEDGSCSCGDYW